MRDSALVEYRRVKGSFDDMAVVGSNVNVPYLNNIHRILEFGYKTVAVIRDPVFAIASWNTRPARRNPEFRVMEDDRHPRWDHLSFPDEDRIHRQAVIWAYYGNLIADLARDGKVSVMSYERIVAGGLLLGGLIPGLEIRVPGQATMNVDERYVGVPIDRIRSSVRQFSLDRIYEALIGRQDSE